MQKKKKIICRKKVKRKKVKQIQGRTTGSSSVYMYTGTYYG